MHLVATESIYADIWMIAGTLDKPKDIPISHHVNSIGRRKAGALLGLHVLTGADWGGKFAGISKDRWTQRFLSLEDLCDIITVLYNFGDTVSGTEEQKKKKSWKFLRSLSARYTRRPHQS